MGIAMAFLMGLTTALMIPILTNRTVMVMGWEMPATLSFSTSPSFPDAAARASLVTAESDGQHR